MRKGCEPNQAPLTILNRIERRALPLQGFIANPFAGEAAARLGLRRVATLLDRLDRPQNAQPLVHVAGSKGKGSTAVMLAAILTASGHRVGLHTSPHLHTYRERIMMDGSVIPADEFDQVASEALAAAEGLERDQPDLGQVSAFELLFVMALSHFRNRECTVAVVEVGIGGALDATNVIMPAVSVITQLDLEHTAILGATLPEIAAQKAGIIKPDRPVVAAPMPLDALTVVEQIARQRQSPLFLGRRDWNWSGDWRDLTLTGPWGEWADLILGLAGPHQTTNAAVALMAAWFLRDRGIAITEAGARQGLLAATLPGRFERVPKGRVADFVALPAHRAPHIILDGAHTPAAASALISTVDSVFPGARGPVVLGMAADKSVAEVVAILNTIAHPFVMTAAASPRAVNPDDLATIATNANVPFVVSDTVGSALRRAIHQADPDHPIIVTGSFAVVAEARVALGLTSTPPNTTSPASG